MGVDKYVLDPKYPWCEAWSVGADYFELPLARPLVVGSKLVSKYEFALCWLQGGQFLGRAAIDWSLGVGFGEMSCVPGLTPMTYHEYTDQPESFDFDSLMELSERKWDRLIKLMDDKDPPLPAPARFFLEMAFLSLVADEANTTPASVLSSSPRSQVRVNALFEGSLSEAKKAVDEGDFARDTCIKVKVGRRSTSEERAVLDLLMRELGDHVTLRLDGNRMMSPQDVAALLDGFPRERIDYLEEPLGDPLALPELAKNLGVAIALDESLHEEETRDLRFADGIKSWVVKPARVGGFSACQRLDVEAQKSGKEIVLSSCFESPLGLAMQAQWAAALPTHKGPAGLATDRFFVPGAMPCGYDSRSGSIDIQTWRAMPDREWLETHVEHIGLERDQPIGEERIEFVRTYLSVYGSIVRTPSRTSRLSAVFRWNQAQSATSIANTIAVGDVIAIDEPDAVRMLTAMLTVWQAGGVSLPLAPGDPKRLDPDRMAAVGAAWIWRGGKLESRSGHSSAQRLPEHASLLVQTSGSTGTPRLIVHSLRELFHDHFEMTALLSDTPRHSKPSWLLTLSPHHVGGLMIAMRCIALGWELILPDPAMPLLEAIKTHEPSWVSLVPTQLSRLLDDREGARELAKCDGVLLGGGPSSSTLRRKAIELGVPLVVSYGSTETAGMIASTRDPAHVVEATCAGEVHWNRRVVLSDDGEIHVGGFRIALGVFEDGAVRDLCVPARTPKDFALGGGLMPTGDIGEMRDGHLHVLGRRDRMFISGGENIHPESIERCLLDHEYVEACAVIDVPDEAFGARPVAFVTTKKDTRADALRGYLRDHLPGFAVPNAFFEMPAAAIGSLKVSPAVLRTIYANPAKRSALRPL